MKINETLDSSISFGEACLKPGEVFYDPQQEAYFLVTDKRSGWCSGTLCVNLTNGEQHAFVSMQSIIPCQEISLTVRR